MSKVTQEQIDKWKKEHPRGVFLVTAEGKNAYISVPDRKVMAAAMAQAAVDPFGDVETVYQNCWLAGDEEMRTEENLLLSAKTKMDDLFEIVEVEVKKL